MIYFSNKIVLKRSQFETYKCWIINGAVFTVIMLIFFVDGFSNLSFLKLLLKGILHAPWIVALYIIANLIFQNKAFKTLLFYTFGIITINLFGSSPRLSVVRP